LRRVCVFAPHPQMRAPKPVAASSKRPRVRTLSVDELAVSYYLNAGGGSASERLQREGDASARLSASAPHLAFTCAAGRLTIRYKALRTALEERVQALTVDGVCELLRAVRERGSSASRRAAPGAAAALLAPREMAARCPCAFWNAVRHFGSAEAAVAAAFADDSAGGGGGGGGDDAGDAPP
jgi:hypothetical protein